MEGAKEHHDAPFMDKQNEGIKDPEVKEILYDMGGYATVRRWGERGQS